MLAQQCTQSYAGLQLVCACGAEKLPGLLFMELYNMRTAMTFWIRMT